MLLTIPGWYFRLSTPLSLSTHLPLMSSMAILLMFPAMLPMVIKIWTSGLDASLETALLHLFQLSNRTVLENNCDISAIKQHPKSFTGITMSSMCFILECISRLRPHHSIFSHSLHVCEQTALVSPGVSLPALDHCSLAWPASFQKERGWPRETRTTAPWLPVPSSVPYPLCVSRQPW